MTHGESITPIAKLKLSLCDYSYVYILVSGTITVTALPTGGVNNGIEVLFKNCAPFTDCISKTSNTKNR